MYLLDKKYNHLIDYLKSLESVILAYSGGVDSSFLLSCLKDSSINALAVIAKSPSMPFDDLETALNMVKALDCEYRLIETNEFNDKDFTNNPPDRCFYCKKELFSKLRDMAIGEGYKHVIDGSTCDDLNDYRPGSKAKEMFNIKSPLIDAGLKKEDIRQLSRKKGLDTWDKPSSPCLSSRIPYGEKIDLKSLKMIERAESILKEFGFKELRVRKQGGTARIEPDEKDINKFIDNDIRKEIVSSFKNIGFHFITLDLEGYQTGKLNRGIFV